MYFFTQIEVKHKEGSVGKPSGFCLFAVIYGRDLNSLKSSCKIFKSNHQQNIFQINVEEIWWRGHGNEKQALFDCSEYVWQCLYPPTGSVS